MRVINWPDWSTMAIAHPATGGPKADLVRLFESPRSLRKLGQVHANYGSDI